MKEIEKLLKEYKIRFRDIARKANLTDAQVWRRLSELERLDKIKKVGDKICDVSKRSVSVYAIKE